LEIAESRPELLAHHCTEAGWINEAIDYWTKAGQLSLARSAMVEATRQVRKGLALLSSLVESSERQRKELALQATLGWAEFQSKGEGAPEVCEASVRARALCDQLGDRSSLGSVLYMQACHHITRAEFTIARRVAEEQLAVAREHSDPGLEVHAHQNLGRTLHWLGEFASAVAHFEGTLAGHVPEMRHQSLWHPPADAGRAIALSYLATDLLILGHLDQGMMRSTQGLVLARRVSYPYGLAIALLQAASFNRLRGMDQAVLDFAAEASAIGEEQRFPLFVVAADLQRGIIASSRGETAEGLALVRRACANFAAIGHGGGRTGQLCALACCCERAGEVDEALDLLNAALERANATQERYFEAELYRYRAGWLVAHHRATEAEAESCYERALAVSRFQKAKFWELRAASSLARLWRDQNRRAEAHDLLAPIYGWFTEGFDTPDLRDAKALLDELQ
jgi:predicted ATPase